MLAEIPVFWPSFGKRQRADWAVSVANENEYSTVTPVYMRLCACAVVLLQSCALVATLVQPLRDNVLQVILLAAVHENRLMPVVHENRLMPVMQEAAVNRLAACPKTTLKSLL